MNTIMSQYRLQIAIFREIMHLSITHMIWIIKKTEYNSN